MYEKAVVLEIKEKYCIAMLADSSIVRIQKKPGMRTGQKVYILEEDLYRADVAAKGVVVLPFVSRDMKKRKAVLTKVFAAAAALLVFLGTLSIPSLSDAAYATVSFDGEQSVQFELDRECRILRAVSYDGTVGEAALKDMEGRKLNQLWETLRGFARENERMLVADAPMRRSAESMADALEEEIADSLTGEKILKLRGEKKDVKAADWQGRSLGIYMLEKAMDEEMLETQFGGKDADVLAVFMETYKDRFPEIYKKYRKLSEDEEERDEMRDDDVGTSEDDDRDGDVDDEQRPGSGDLVNEPNDGSGDAAVSGGGEDSNEEDNRPDGSDENEEDDSEEEVEEED